MLQPRQSATAGINLHRQRDEAEQRRQRKQHNACTQYGREDVDQQDACQQHPRHNPRRERHYGNQRRAQLQRGIALDMLQHMPTLMGCNSCRSHVTLAIDGLAQPHHLLRGVVVVGKGAFHKVHIDVRDAVVAHHPQRHVTPRHTTRKRLFGVLLELALKRCLNDIAQDGNRNENNVYDHIRYLLFYNLQITIDLQFIYFTI